MLLLQLVATACVAASRAALECGCTIQLRGLVLALVWVTERALLAAGVGQLALGDADIGPVLDQLGVELLVHALLGASMRGDLRGDGPLKLRDNGSVHSVTVPALVILLLNDAVK